MQRTDVREIAIQSALYPSEWKPLADAPQILYAVGNINLLKTRKFTVVGSRRTPAAALRLGAEICKTLSGAYTLVTGTADGGDGAAIEGALQGTGNVICLLAGGFSTLPQGNALLLKRVAEKGLLLSAHPFDTPVRAFSYEYRNKLLALLGEGTLVLGAAEKSGALITAKYAGAYNKPVFALPYAAGTAAGAGCNALIKKGAHLTETAFDIAEKTGIIITAQKTAKLTADEEKLVNALRELGEGHAAELAAKSGVPVFKARAVLSALEVKGLAVSVGGNAYSIVK